MVINHKKIIFILLTIILLFEAGFCIKKTYTEIKPEILNLSKLIDQIKNQISNTIEIVNNIKTSKTNFIKKLNSLNKEISKIKNEIKKESDEKKNSWSMFILGPITAISSYMKESELENKLLQISNELNQLLRSIVKLEKKEKFVHKNSSSVLTVINENNQLIQKINF